MSEETIVVKAPRHRYFSVLGLFYSLKIEVLNQVELENAALSNGPLRFICLAKDRVKVEAVIAQLRKEHGEEFTITGAD